MKRTQSHLPDLNERGNVFFALFGAMALLAVLGVTVSTFIRGPLSSSVDLTRVNVAESQMSVMAQALVMQSSSAANCDGDPQVEPVIWRTASAGVPIPTGGGLLPDSFNVISSKDPWGTEYGYCAWDHGVNACTDFVRLRGATTSAEGQTVVALVSAGPDKKFTTTCRTFAAADFNSNGLLTDAGDLPLVSKANVTDDDIIFTYSYKQAASVSGGLWSLKSADEEIATIDKDLAITGSGAFDGVGAFPTITADTLNARSTNFIDFLDGLKLPDISTYNPICNGSMAGVVRRNGSSVQMCYSNAWTSISAAGGSGGGGNQFVTDTSAACNTSKAGGVRYNSGLMVPEFCNGTAWKAFVTQSTAVILSVTPSVDNTFTVSGPCSSDCPYARSTPHTFTVTNIGTATSGTITETHSNIEVDSGASTCGAALLPGQSCSYSLYARMNGNYTRAGSLVISQGGTPVFTVITKAVSSDFACTVGMFGWGGVVATCANATTPGYVLDYVGCEYSPGEPVCDPAEYDPGMNMNIEWAYPNNVTTTSGQQNAVNLAGYGSPLAARYCDQLISQGYDDWFLPSVNESQTIIYPVRVAAQISTGWPYWTSNYHSTTTTFPRFYTYNYGTNSSAIQQASWVDGFHVRCLRRHNVAFPTRTADTTPVLRYSSLISDTGYRLPGESLGAVYTTAASQVKSSEYYTVYGINSATAVTIAGGTSPTFSINGRAAGTTGNVYNGDTIQIFGTGPAATGNETTVTLTIGGSNFTWLIRYPAANTRKMFVTSTTYNGNLGGIAGADAKCAARATAAGLTGIWYAYVGVQYNGPEVRIPWSWTRLENMAGEVIATSFTDLLTRPPASTRIDQANVSEQMISAPIKYNESGVLTTNNTVWGGHLRGTNAITTGWDFETCNAWTSSASSMAAGSGTYGRSDSSTIRWINYENYSACNIARSLYCIGPF